MAEKPERCFTCYRVIKAGQTCGAGSRTLIAASRKGEIVAAFKAATEVMPVGGPKSGAPDGPVVSAKQWDSIQGYIEKGIEVGSIF